MSRRILLALMGVLLLALALPAFAWDPTPSGYAQFRYNYSDSDDDGDFEARRIRLSWKDTVNDQGTTARVQFDLADLVEGDEVVLKDAWVMHPWSETFSSRFGYGDTLFGIDVEYSSSARLPFERARVTRDFFPGEKDLGIYFTYEGQQQYGPILDLGVSNGMDAWHDDDDEASAFVARLTVPFDSSEAGISYMSANREGDGYDVEPSVWGAHVRYEAADTVDWALQAEYMDGEYLRGGNYYDANGWYATVEVTPPASEATLFYRYDERERTLSMAAAAQEGATETYQRNTFGVAWDFMPMNRLTLQIEDIDNAGSSSTDFGVQWQVSYK